MEHFKGGGMYCSLGLTYIWHVNHFERDAPGLSFHSFPLHACSSILSPLISSSSFLFFPSFCLHSLLLTLLLCCLGPFMTAELIWGNQYLHYVEGQVRDLVWRVGGGCLVEPCARVWEGGGVCCSINVSPLIFSACLCVCEGPQWAGWALRGGLIGVCLCLWVVGVMWLLYTN